MAQEIKQWVPHEYQEDAIQWVLEGFDRENCSALFLQPGLGKTSCSLEVFKRMKAAGKAKTMLIVAPLRVAQQTWPTELRKWINFFDLTYTVLHGADKDVLLKRKTDIYIINYEGLAWLFSQNWKAPDILCFDELSKMKSWSAGRVKLMKIFLPTFKYRVGLTGTPATNGLVDLFSQVYMLDRGTRFGRAITRFKDRYFIQNCFSYKLLPNENTIHEIYEKVATLAFSIDPKKWIELPDEVHNVILIDMPPKLKAQYKELEKEFVVYLENGAVISAKMASVLSTKLRQFLSGKVYTNERNIESVHHIKYEALEDLVEEMAGQPLLVGYMYQHEVPEFKKRFPQAEFIESNTSTVQLIDIINRWNAGKIELLFGHPASVGHGLNLQGACNNVCFYSLDFNLDNTMQFIKRVARQGQKEKSVFIHFLLFKGSIDEYILKTLNGKEMTQQSLLDFINDN